MSMEDKITDNIELHGSLDLDRLNTLIDKADEESIVSITLPAFEGDTI